MSKYKTLMETHRINELEDLAVELFIKSHEWNFVIEHLPEKQLDELKALYKKRGILE